MTNLDWRCAAAQVFVGGQITQIDDYWQSNVLGANIYQLIDDCSMWQNAFGAEGKRVKDKWRTMLAMRHGRTSAGDLTRRLLGNLAGKNECKLGTDLFNALKSGVVMPLQRMHDQASLTINFKAGGWFTHQAGFDEYTTMWDRKATGQALTTSPDTQNPAHVRAKADRWALYGQFDDSKRRAAVAGLQLPHVKKTTDPKTYKESWDYSTGTKTPKTAPSASNPADNQVYAGLNYGDRPHGSSTRYGNSFFELSDEYKKEAIYIAMDSFTPVSTGSGAKAKAQRAKLFQVNAGSFGGAILLAIQSQDPQQGDNSKALIAELLSSARNGGSPKPDTNHEHLLIEAHIFRKVKMNSDCIKSVCVSDGECGPTETTNAAKFGKRCGIPVKFVA